jgi:hypothetical protein
MAKRIVLPLILLGASGYMLDDILSLFMSHNDKFRSSYKIPLSYGNIIGKKEGKVKKMLGSAY